MEKNALRISTYKYYNRVDFKIKIANQQKKIN